MKYIKWIIGLCLILSALSACFLPPAESCSDSPEQLYCIDKGEQWPYVAFFQKIGQFGHTDSEQRWKDVSSCGGIDISKETNEFKIKGSPDEKGLMVIKVVRSFERCMEDKGYKKLFESFCGTQHPDWDKGKCNL